MITKGREGGEGVRVGKAWGKVRHHWHIGEVKATRSASGKIVVGDWEMPVAVGIGARGCDVRRIEHIRIDQSDLQDPLAWEA